MAIRQWNWSQISPKWSTANSDRSKARDERSSTRAMSTVGSTQDVGNRTVGKFRCLLFWDQSFNKKNIFSNYPKDPDMSWERDYPYIPILGIETINPILGRVWLLRVKIWIGKLWLGIWMSKVNICQPYQVLLSDHILGGFKWPFRRMFFCDLHFGWSVRVSWKKTGQGWFRYFLGNLYL